MGKIVTVFTEEAPKPLGHYSQAVRGGGLIHISGQLPIPKSGVPDNQSAKLLSCDNVSPWWVSFQLRDFS